MPDPSDIQIITVAYNSTAVIGDMLASVPAGVEVVIVDNASTDAEALHALAQAHGARVVTNDTNRGFGVACNIGAAVGDSQFLFFLNPDAQMQPGCLEGLLAAAEAYPEASSFSPRVLDRRGRPAFRRRSRLLPKAEYWSGPPPEADAEVPLLNGAAVFVARAHFEAVGGFDEQIFLYHEDDDLSLRLKAKFGPIRHVHGATVTHAEGHSTARTPATAAFKARHMAQSAVYTMRKHERPFARAQIIGWALLQLASPLTLLSARKRAKNMGFLQGALRPISPNEK
ncbi:glycosyltransferase family 2 protein [Tateyamaria armeniaca]|uniref:Glycosyltransferase family 2 protein n=1 Tax=Tateyamaria armeniaca TaxID=2518930 RepID=A0ABW8URF4_9RHOB